MCVQNGSRDDGPNKHECIRKYKTNQDFHLKYSRADYVGACCSTFTTPVCKQWAPPCCVSCRTSSIRLINSHWFWSLCLPRHHIMLLTGTVTWNSNTLQGGLKGRLCGSTEHWHVGIVIADDVIKWVSRLLGVFISAFICCINPNIQFSQ